MSSNGTHSDLPLFPSLLFGGVVPQSSPVAELPKSPPLSVERQEIIERVHEAAEPEFIQMYRAFLMSYAERVEDFIAGEITSGFEQQHGKLSVIEGKQLGGAFQLCRRVD